MRMPIVPLQNLVILLSSVGVLGLSCRVVNPELIEDDSILDHGTQRAQQPGDRFHNVLGVLRVAEDAQSVGQVARQGKEEEEERKSCSIFVSHAFHAHLPQIIIPSHIPSQDFSL